jgi:hypothetical protein
MANNFTFSTTQIKYLTGRSINTLTTLITRNSTDQSFGFQIGDTFIEGARVVSNESDYADMGSGPIHGYYFQGMFYPETENGHRDEPGVLYIRKSTTKPLFYKYYSLFIGLQQQQVKNSHKYAVGVATDDKQVLLTPADDHNPLDYVWSYLAPSQSKSMAGLVKNYNPSVRLRHDHPKGRYYCNCTNAGIVNGVFPDTIVLCAHLHTVLRFHQPDLAEMIKDKQPHLDVESGVTLRSLESFAQSLR